MPAVTPPQKVNQNKRKGDPKGGGKGQGAKTRHGETICDAWNKGGCKEPCTKQQVHVCDFWLKDGSACTSSSHRRVHAH